MNLTSLYLNNVVAGSSADMVSGGRSKNKASGFDSFLKKADGNDYQKKAETVKSESKYDNKKQSEPKVNKRDDKNDAKKENIQSNKKDDRAETRKNVKTEKVTTNEKADSSNQANDKMIDKIADELNMSAEDVKKILESLNMTAADLADQSNLISFMEKAMDVDNALDLLSIDGVKDMMKNIKNIVSEMSEFSMMMSEDMGEENIDDILNTENAENSEVKDIQGESLKENSEVFEEVVSENAENRELRREIVQENRNSENQNTQQENNYSVSAALAEHNAENQTGEGNSDSGSLQNVQMGQGVSGGSMENVNRMFSDALDRATGGRDVNAADVIKQIVENFRVNSSNGIDEIRIMLKPDHLGNVTITVATENGIVTANIIAESEKVKGIIDDNLSQLKDILDSQGIQVSEINVNVGTDESDNARDIFRFAQEKSSKRINDILGNFEDEIEEVQENIITEKDVLQNEVSYMA